MMWCFEVIKTISKTDVQQVKFSVSAKTMHCANILNQGVVGRTRRIPRNF